MAHLLVLLCPLLLSLQLALSCVNLIGHANDSTVSLDNSTTWDYAFQGDDWAGVDATGSPWACLTGSFQSPLDLPPITNVTSINPKLRAYFRFSPLQSPSLKSPAAFVWNNGHTIQVQDFLFIIGGIEVPTLGRHVIDVLTPEAALPGAALQTVFLPAIQFHFHTSSEHVLGGWSGTMELHIVHRSQPGNVGLVNCPPGGCHAVIGVFINVLLDGADNPYLAPILDAAPFREGEAVPLPIGTVLDLANILPQNTNYITYQGSLTTPPCSEGLLWMVMAEPIFISLKQYKQYQNAIGAKSCTAGVAAEADSAPDHRRHRRLSEAVLPNATCSLAAWDQNFRLTQHTNGRQVLAMMAT